MITLVRFFSTPGRAELALLREASSHVTVVKNPEAPYYWAVIWTQESQVFIC